jgi:hypothetical protein
MRRIDRDPERFEVLNLYDVLGRNLDLKIDDSESKSKFIETITQSIERISDNDQLIYGQRTQSLFSYVAASLGKAKFIKEEDSGEVIHQNNEILPPDFEVVLNDEERFLVEVKNCHDEETDSELRLESSYIEKIEKYSSLVDCETKIAIYWSRWKLWNLVSLDWVKEQDGEISLLQSAKANEMSLLGDMMVGTIPPLSIRLVTDPDKPRAVDKNGEVEFTIGNVSILCDDSHLTNSREKDIAIFLIQFGGWPVSNPRPVIDDEELIYLEMTCEPPEYADQPFQTVGWMSSMISRQYDSLTTEAGDVEKISPDVKPGNLGISIPQTHESENLPLWRFYQQPVT